MPPFPPSHTSPLPGHPFSYDINYILGYGSDFVFIWKLLWVFFTYLKCTHFKAQRNQKKGICGKGVVECRCYFLMSDDITIYGHIFLFFLFLYYHFFREKATSSCIYIVLFSRLVPFGLKFFPLGYEWRHFKSNLFFFHELRS